MENKELEEFKDKLFKKLRIEIMKLGGPQAACVMSMQRNDERRIAFKEVIKMIENL